MESCTGNTAGKCLKERYEQLRSSYSPGSVEYESVGDIWIPVGWCNSDPYDYDGEECDGAGQDPVVRNMLLVVTKKGTGDRQGRLVENTGPANKVPWEFDVYWRFQTAVASYENLPCWMGSCNRNQLSTDQDRDSEWGLYNRLYDPNFRIGDPQCTEVPLDTTAESEAYDIHRPILISQLWSGFSEGADKYLSVVGSFKDNIVSWFSEPTYAQSVYPQFISGYSVQFSDQSMKDKVLGNTYMFASSGGLPSSNKVIGTLTNDGVDFQVVINGDLSAMPPVPTGVPAGEVTEVFLQNAASVYKYYIVHSNKGQGYTLKLETFHPPEIVPTIPVTNSSYDWWWPACKPAIYLYPQAEERLSVFVEPQGYITESIPPYGDGWRNILAKPNGELTIGGLSYPYLYYEANLTSVTAPTTGWVVYRDNLGSFFELTLSKLGLNRQEAEDFSEYWLGRLTDKPYYFVGLVERSQLDTLEKITFSDNPDTFIRVRMFFEALDTYHSVLPYSLSPTPQRVGFTAVDWGGVIKNGSCTGGIVSAVTVE